MPPTSVSTSSCRPVRPSHTAECRRRRRQRHDQFNMLVARASGTARDAHKSVMKTENVRDRVRERDRGRTDAFICVSTQTRLLFGSRDILCRTWLRSESLSPAMRLLPPTASCLSNASQVNINSEISLQFEFNCRHLRNVNLLYGYAGVCTLLRMATVYIARVYRPVSKRQPHPVRKTADAQRAATATATRHGRQHNHTTFRCAQQQQQRLRDVLFVLSSLRFNSFPFCVFVRSILNIVLNVYSELYIVCCMLLLSNHSSRT